MFNNWNLLPQYVKFKMLKSSWTKRGKTDARVVEVFILLDDSEAVSRFTNMQVKVEIQP